MKSKGASQITTGKIFQRLAPLYCKYFLNGSLRGNGTVSVHLSFDLGLYIRSFEQKSFKLPDYLEVLSTDIHILIKT